MEADHELLEEGTEPEPATESEDDKDDWLFFSLLDNRVTSPNFMILGGDIAFYNPNPSQATQKLNKTEIFLGYFFWGINNIRKCFLI